MKQIIDEYNVQKADKEDIGFNLFTIISDTFYRENFHRDIIYEFLNPQGSHKEGNKYLMLFLDMLNISRSLFKDAIVEKEYTIENNRRIDTLITDKTTMKLLLLKTK
ncbi:PD-(D/E)XK nuclease family protein [Segatella paludivivens]|uniref:PD-(D/E)XK nuclease family protein n=1 Tax=Segatella paludivivens TaxID=185294 RepID=UPI000472295E|nr:PD-(D/E)XK nuclease family protein [Segatella paludivivens]